MTRAPELVMPRVAVPLAERVIETTAGAARLLVLPVPVRDVVSFRGSFRTAPDFTTDDDHAQALVTGLLDKGTRHRDRFAIAEALEGRGAELHFYSDGLRVGFAGRALKGDLADVLALLAEQLREPLLDADEFEKSRARTVAAVRRGTDSTGQQASGLLARRLYAPAHPNFVPEPAAERAAFEALTPERVRDYHARHVGADALTLAFAGDLDPSEIERTVAAQLGDWPAHGGAARFDAEATPQPPGREARAIADRPNLDVRFGHPLALRRDSDDYLALHAANHALGGNFSARLMTVVRDELGLTYGIGSSLAGVAVEHGGHWQIGVTLSADALDRGIEATRGVVARFVEEGVAENELDDTRETLAGQHVVALATTGGLAARLLVNAERGFDVGYLDRYPALTRALTRDDVNAAARRHLDPAALHTTLAGTLPA